MKTTLLAAMAALFLLGATTAPARGDHDGQKQGGDGPKLGGKGAKEQVTEEEGDEGEGNNEEQRGKGDQKGGYEKQKGNGPQGGDEQDGGGPKQNGCCKYKKVVTYKTVVVQEVKRQRYVKCVTLYDECDKPYKVNKAYYRDVEVPVEKVVACVKWVRIPCPPKKVVTYKTVVVQEVKRQRYVKCVTLYDECDKPYKVNKAYYRDVEVPVEKVVVCVKWVKTCKGCDDDVPPAYQQ